MSRSIGSNPRGDVSINSFMSVETPTGEFGLQKILVPLDEGWTKAQLTLSRIEKYMNIALLCLLLAHPRHKKSAQTRQPQMSMVSWIHEKNRW